MDLRIVTVEEGEKLVQAALSDDGVDVRHTIEMLKPFELNIAEVGDATILFKVLPEVNGDVSLSEFFIYIPRDKRGNLSNLKKIKLWFEETAKELECDCIKIGSNFGLNDDGFGRLLEKWGYTPDTYRKKV